MKNLLALLLVFLALGEMAVAQNLSNRGKEFWVGYGHHQFMEPGQNNSQEMVLYFSAEQPANVRVTINGTTYVRDYAVPANSVIASELIPKNGTNDCRLYSVPLSFGGTGGEGVFNRGIHIVSDVPIVAYAHIYGSASSGATMLMPVETWGYSYATINSQQRYGSNNDCFSWVYVVAKEDNTVVEITPSERTRNGRNRNVPFTATLNKGQIYQVIGASISNGTGYDLTGTKVKSIANAAGECFPIGVFAGSSRTYITCSGTGGVSGDNIMQQIFPFQAWGKRYLTAPTSSGNNPSSFHTNIYRVAVKDPTAVVKRNGVQLTGLRNNFYYEYQSNTADYIESDKPILISQYMATSGSCPNTSGDGDPEMMYISPIEQAIKRVGFYRNDEENIKTNYITLVIPNAGVPSLRIDGSSVFSHTYPHPNLPGYTVVIRRWTAAKAQCIVQSDSAFTAITYGLGSVESYGYNAGTLINNLSAISAVRNVLDVTSSEHKFTCTNTPAELSVLLAYQPTKLQWLFSELGNSIAPNTNVVDNAPISTGTTTVNGIVYYKYTLPGTYTFSSIDTFRIPILATHPSVENCNNTERLTIEVIVKEKPKADFSFSHLGCTLDTVYLSGSNTTTNNFTLSQWKWDFPGSVTQNGQMVKHLLPPGNQNIKLMVVSSDGCIGDTTKQINVLDKPSAAFSVSPSTGCEGTVMTFTGTAANLNSNPVNAWYWDFGNGINATPTSNTPQAVTYSAPGNYIVKHVVKTSATCVSDTTKTTVTVSPRPAKPVAASAITFCQNGTASPLSATALAAHTLTWYTAFPLAGGSPNAPTPSTTTAGTTSFYVTQTSTVTGCVSDTSRIDVIIVAAITANTISADQTICAGTAAAALTGPGVTGGTGTYTYQWQSSTNGGTTWTNIAGATTANYNPGVLPSGTTHFRRMVNSGVCSSTSNVVSITAETSLSNYEISGAQTVCEGVMPALLVGQTPTGGTGTYSYQWAVSTDGTNWTNIPGATGKDYQPISLTTNTYFRRITSGGNCPATSAPVLITVNPMPNGTITAPTGICSYQTADVVFNASAGTAPYAIQLVITNPGGGSTTINQTINSTGPVNINVIPLNSTAGTYTVQLTNISDSKGCSRTTGMSSLNILVTAKPNVSASAAATTICEGTSTTLNASGATSYTWSPSTGLSATTGNNITASPKVNTIYQVIGVTNGCGDTATVDITVIARPAKPVVSALVEYCLDAPAAALNATALPGHTLNWYNTPSLIGGNTTAPTPSTTTAGTFYYFVTQTNNNGCVSDTSVITVTVRPLPLVDFDLPAGVCMPNGTASFTNKTTIPGNASVTYSWDFGDNSTSVTTKDGAHIYAAAGSYDVTLTATSAFGCVATRTKTFSAFFEKPVANFVTNRPELCQGQDSYFTDQSNPSGSTITKWWWSFGDGQVKTMNNPSHRYKQADTFSVQLVVTTAIGCVSDTFEQDVVVHLQPKIDAGPSFVVPVGTTVQFKATANDTTTVRMAWTPPSGLSSPTSLNPTLTVTENRTYTLTAVGDGNCMANDTLTVRMLKPIEVPNVFSPNGDGINDTWMITNLADYPGAKVEVFNRWGQQVLLSYGYNRPWDGTFLGKPLPLATYYYVITLNNGFKPVTGSVTIIK